MSIKPPNQLYYGDNLDILRRYIKDESVDLVYLDPPFNSNADYNVLFAEKSGDKAGAQIKAFGDSWQWGIEAASEYAEVMHSGNDSVAKALKGMHDFLSTSDMMAYIAMMAIRLIELRRVLKPTGSIYLHCDPTASHYLKIIMDAVFGPTNYRNEIIWKRTSAHSAAKRWNEVHDVILFYSCSADYCWNRVELAHSDEYSARYRRTDDSGQRWTDDNLTAPGVRHGDSGAEWRGYDPTAKGLHWKSNSKTVEDLIGSDAANVLSTTEKLDLLDKNGFILWPKRSAVDGGGFPRFKRYLGSGQPIQDIITDIPPLNSQAQERLGYPTQKPTSLLERILCASSNPGDVVLDPFCGCGTTIAAAHKLDRKWIGIDITHLAVTLIKSRLHDSFGPKIVDAYSVLGEPVDLESARQLADEDKFQFQVWALGLVGARPLVLKKGADKGIDGRLYFSDSSDDSELKETLISVKGGHVTVNQVRDLRGVIERDKAAIGVFICIEPPTGPMKREAAEAGFYTSPAGTQHARLQILTVEELIGGKGIDLPRWHAPETFKKAPKAKRKPTATNKKLGFDD